MRNLLVFALLGFLLIAPVVYSQEEEDINVTEDDPIEETEDYEDEDEDGGMTSHVDIRTTIYFPDSPIEKKFILGEPVTFLVGFENVGDIVFDLDSVGAYLHSPVDYSYMIQNYSRKAVGLASNNKQMITIEYAFRPSLSLEPMAFLLSANVVYNSSLEDYYLNTVFNDTIEFFERETVIDFRQLFILLIGLGILGAVGFYLATGPLKSLFKRKKKYEDNEESKSKRRKPKQH